MTALADVSLARDWAHRIETLDAERLGVTVADVRPKLARRLRAAPGTLENLRRGRLKSVPSWFLSRVRAELIAVLQSEVTKLEHEIAIHRQAGADHRSDDLAKAQAQILSAKKILSAASGGVRR